MASISWPISVLPPAVLLQSYKNEAKQGIIRTDMETGLARQRRRFGLPPSKVTVSWIMDGFQVQFFKSWLYEVAGGGGVWFNLNLRLAVDVDTIEARFSDGVSYTLLAPQANGLHTWKVDAKLEVKDPPQLSADSVQLLTDYTSADVLAAALDAQALLSIDFVTPIVSAI